MDSSHLDRKEAAQQLGLVLAALSNRASPFSETISKEQATTAAFAIYEVARSIGLDKKIVCETWKSNSEFVHRRNLQQIAEFDKLGIFVD